MTILQGASTLGNTALFYKFVAGGVILSVAAAIGVAALPGGSAPGALLAVIVAAGWLTLLLLRERAMRLDTNAQVEHSRMQFAALAGNLGGALDQCAGEFKSQLATARGELDQVQSLFFDAILKLVSGFASITAQTRAQEQLVMAITSGQASAGARGDALHETHQVSHALTLAEAAGELARITIKLEQDVNAAVTTLQFQDIATQLLGHVSRRADVLTGVADKIGALAGVLAAKGMPAIDDATRAQGLRRVCDELIAVLASVHQATHMNPVRQTSMAVGEVELY
jgi:hypothetical protein